MLHADPHGGNLVKVRDSVTGEARLGYLDFGLLQRPTTELVETERRWGERLKRLAALSRPTLDRDPNRS